MSSIAFCKSNPRAKNQTLMFDIVASVFVSGLSDVDFNGTIIDGGHASILDFSHARIKDLHIEGSVIEKVNISNAAINKSRSLIVRLARSKASLSEDAMPIWLSGNSVDVFASIATTSRIRAANLLPTQKVLATVLRKTFFQKGSGRKGGSTLERVGQAG